MDQGRVESELSRAIHRLLVKEPFFGHLLMGVARTIGDETPSAAVSARGGQLRLLVNPEFFLGKLRSGPERVAVIKHEALHLLFKHVLRMQTHGVQTHALRPHGVRPDVRLWNVAADLVVNQHIQRPWVLPPDALTLATFPDLGLRPDRSVETYYARLAELQDELDALRPRGAGTGGSGSGEGGEVSIYDQTSAPESARALDQIADWHSDHGHWSGEDTEAAAEVRAAEVAVEGLVAQVAQKLGERAVGNLPGVVRRLVQAILVRRRNRVDWRRVVRLFTSSSRSTRIVGTNRRRSKRYGTFPGNKVERRARIAVALDTSASIRDDELGAFLSEVHGLWRLGVELVIFETDVQVQREYRYAGRFPDRVGGRGGTGFDAVFRRLRRDRRERWDGCLYFTDGFGPPPSVAPPCRLLWVLSADGKEGPHLRPGKVVRLPPTGA